MRSKHFIYLLACGCLWLLAGCDRNLVVPSQGKQKIVLLGELVAGDSVQLRAGISTVMQSGAMINEDLIQNLDIQLKDGHNSFSLTGTEDDFSFTEHTVSFSSAQATQAGTAYELTAIHPQLGTASAKVMVPQAFNTVVTDTSGTMFNGESCIQLNIQLEDQAAQNYYVIEVLRQSFTLEDVFQFNGQWLKKSEAFNTYDSLLNAGVTPPEKTDTFNIPGLDRVTFYTTDAQSEHLLNGNSKTLCRRMLLSDRSFNGSMHPTSILLPRSQVSTYPGSWTRTLVQIKSIAEDYFLFLKGYEQYDPFAGFLNTGTPVRATGNITDGVGMIGGVFKREFAYSF